mgnify:CR=1 FL=1
MTNQQLYNELLRLLEKEAKAEAVKCFIRQTIQNLMLVSTAVNLMMRKVL